MSTCRKCPHYRHVKEPAGGLRKSGKRICAKTGKPIAKVKNINPVTRQVHLSYPEHCTME